jgi:hypothetical protein
LSLIRARTSSCRSERRRARRSASDKLLSVDFAADAGPPVDWREQELPAPPEFSRADTATVPATYEVLLATVTAPIEPEVIESYGKRAKAQMPVVALVDQFYARVQERGGNRWDTCSLIDLLQKP